MWTAFRLFRCLNKLPIKRKAGGNADGRKQPDNAGDVFIAGLCSGCFGILSGEGL